MWSLTGYFFSGSKLNFAPEYSEAQFLYSAVRKQFSLGTPFRILEASFQFLWLIIYVKQRINMWTTTSCNFSWVTFQKWLSLERWWWQKGFMVEQIFHEHSEQVVPHEQVILNIKEKLALHVRNLVQQSTFCDSPPNSKFLTVRCCRIWPGH